MAVRLPVLMYHSVSRHASPRFARWTVSPEQFESHLQVLGESGCTAVTASTVAEAARSGSPLPDRPVAITFDDGFADFRRAAFPVLRSFSFASTLFVSTAYLDGTARWLQPEGEGDRPMLSRRDLPWLADRGVEIGAHGHSHAMLDLLPPVLMARDVARSKAVVDRLVGEDMRTFAYPHGHADPRTRHAVREMGFTASFGVADSVACLNGDPFDLPRLIVADHTTAEVLARWVSGGRRTSHASLRRARARAGRWWRSRRRAEQIALAEREADTP